MTPFEILEERERAKERVFVGGAKIALIELVTTNLAP